MVDQAQNIELGRFTIRSEDVSIKRVRLPESDNLANKDEVD